MPINRVPPGSQSSLREANRARIVDSIKRLGAMTQVELSDLTGLSPATVSIIVNELVASGIVTTSHVTRSGRRALQVELSRGLGLVAGLHFSTRTLRVTLGDASGNVVSQQRLPLPADHRHDTDLDRAAQLLADMQESIGGRSEELLGAGLAICAPYNAESDSLSVPGLLRGWDEVSICEALSKRIGKPVVADNDSNLAMLAEARFGKAKDVGSAVYVSIGHGIGAGLCLNGEIVRGAKGTAGEIGHIKVVENGELCKCGNRGCLETVVSADALAGQLRDAIGAVQLRDVISMAKAGDLGASRVIADAAGYTGRALSALCNVFDPEIIIIGGELASAGGIFTAPLEAALERYTLHNPLHPPRVEVTELDEFIACKGAMSYAVESVGLPAQLRAVA
ncbi:MAG: ROK family transcriptional regulator [Propionibacteriaceae bacterium]|jgi:predicted NBD/HSP70 family sugar kinase|nr:ROK family transcriptional regulator [Propionibacteriaceae bacterium]